MSNKVKMKCAVCHKSFKSSKPTQILCEDCERKRRQEKGQVTPVQPAQRPVTTPAGAKPAWLEKAIVRDETVSANQPATHEPLQPSRLPTIPRADQHQRVTAGQQPATKPMAATPKKTAKTPPREATKAPRPPKEPTKLFEPSSEQTAAIEQRYMELAQPEFDGIRTQIAHEMQIPKSAVKRVVAQLRTRRHLPSWWEMQNFAGSPADLERIRVAYIALLPTPPLGVHKQIAQDLQLPPSQVYHAIRSIRLALGMPVFNPPESHPELHPKPLPAEATAH